MALPFVFSRETADPFHALRWCVLAIGAAAALAAGIRSHGPRPLSPAAGIFLAGWLAFSLLSCIPALDKPEAAWQFIRDSAWAGFLVGMAAACVRAPGLAGMTRLLRRVAVSSALLGAVAAAGQYWGFWFAGEGIGSGPGGLQGNRNLLASLHVLYCPWVLWALLRERGAWRVMSGMALGASAYVLSVAQCRAAWLGLAAMAATAVVMALRASGPRGRKPAGIRRRLPGLILPAILIAAAVACHGFAKPARDDRAGALARVAGTGTAADSSSAQRLALAGKTLRLIGAHPLLGVGGGNWKVAVVGQGLGGTLWPDMEMVEARPYNDWLWTAAEAGVPGALCWLGLWGCALASGWRAAGRGNAEARVPAILLTAGIVGYAALSALDFPKERAEHMAWLAAALGALFAAGSARSPAVPAPAEAARRTAPAFAAFATLVSLMALVVAATVSAAWSGFRWRNEAVLADILGAQARQDWRGMLAAGARLDRRFVDMTEAGAPVDWHLGLARWQGGDSSGAQADFRAALALHPWHTHVLYDLSVARLAGGDAAEAESLLRRTLATSPGFAPAAMNLAVLELRRGDVDAGHEALARVAERRRDGHWHRIDAALDRAKRSMK